MYKYGKKCDKVYMEYHVLSQNVKLTAEQQAGDFLK